MKYFFKYTLKSFLEGNPPKMNRKFLQTIGIAKFLNLKNF